MVSAGVMDPPPPAGPASSLGQRSELLHLAEQLGIDLPAEKRMLQICRQALKELPVGWSYHLSVSSVGSSGFYYHAASKTSQWHYPIQQQLRDAVASERRQPKLTSRTSSATMSRRSTPPGDSFTAGSPPSIQGLRAAVATLANSVNGDAAERTAASPTINGSVSLLRRPSLYTVRAELLSPTAEMFAAVERIQRCYKHFLWRQRYRLWHRRRAEETVMSAEMFERLALGKRRTASIRMQRRMSGLSEPMMLRAFADTRPQTTPSSEAAQRSSITLQRRSSAIQFPSQQLQAPAPQSASLSPTRNRRSVLTDPGYLHNHFQHPAPVSPRHVVSPSLRLDALQQNMRFMRAIVKTQCRFRVRKQHAQELLRAKLANLRQMDLQSIDQQVRASISLGRRATRELRQTLRTTRGSTILSTTDFLQSIPAELSGAQTGIESHGSTAHAVTTADVAARQSHHGPQSRHPDSAISTTETSGSERRIMRRHLRRRSDMVDDSHATQLAKEQVPYTPSLRSIPQLSVTIDAPSAFTQLPTPATPAVFASLPFTPERALALSWHEPFVRFITKMQRRWRAKRALLQRSRQQTLRRLTALKSVEQDREMQHRLLVGKRESQRQRRQTLQQPDTSLGQQAQGHLPTLSISTAQSAGQNGKQSVPPVLALTPRAGLSPYASPVLAPTPTPRSATLSATGSAFDYSPATHVTRLSEHTRAVHASRASISFTRHASAEAVHVALAADSQQLVATTSPRSSPPHPHRSPSRSPQHLHSSYRSATEQTAVLTSNFQLISAIITIQRQFRRKRLQSQQRLQAKLHTLRVEQQHEAKSRYRSGRRSTARGNFAALLKPAIG